MESTDDHVLRLYRETRLSYAKIADQVGITKGKAQSIIERNVPKDQRHERKPLTLRDQLTSGVNDLGLDRSANALTYYRTTLLSYADIGKLPDVMLTLYQVTLLITENTTKEERTARREAQMKQAALKSHFNEAYVPLNSKHSLVNRTNNDRDYHSAPIIITGGQDA